MQRAELRMGIWVFGYSGIRRTDSTIRQLDDQTLQEYTIALLDFRFLIFDVMYDVRLKRLDFTRVHTGTQVHK